MNSRKFSDFKKRNTLLALLSCALYIFIAYFINRSESTYLLSSYAILFALYILICVISSADEVKYWLVVSFIVRLLLLFAVPNLSDDFYRFIWDGRLLQQGIHPFSETPSYYMQAKHALAGLDFSLYQKLNSKEYFTVYPPVAQGIFWLCTVVSPKSVIGSVLVLKILVLIAEVGSLYFLFKLLQLFKLPTKNILFYALNPLVILELCGNLHFEAFLICFLTASIYLLTKENYWQASIAFSLAICVKLIPLIFLPVLFPVLGCRKTFLFYIVTAITCICLFIPLLTTEIISGFHESIGYYFQKFEFNASIYYLVREWGFWKYGYNIVQTLGWKLGLLSGILIILYSYINTFKLQPLLTIQNLPREWLVVFFIYLLFTTTVHPWYCTTLVAFCIFTNYSFPIIWSFLIFLTYIGYTSTGYNENLLIVIIEYSLVLGAIVYEIWKRKSLLLLSS